MRKSISLLLAIVVATNTLAFPMMLPKADAQPKEVVKEIRQEPIVVPKVEPPKVEVPKVEVVEEVPKVEPVKPEPKVERVYYDVELTGYDSCTYCTGSTKGITASGKKASQGTIATPRNIPLGTLISINGEPYRAEDRGGAIVVRSDGVYVFDVWFPTHKQALNFGRVHAKMYEENGIYYIEY